MTAQIRHLGVALGSLLALAGSLEARQQIPVAEPVSEIRSERLYLSGSGPSDAKPWPFRLGQGRGAGRDTTIPVPSQWQLQGLGAYAYGHDEDRPRGVGTYQLRFEVPTTWRDRHVALVFEGVMTDTSVRVNGQSAGPIHQGGFTRFRFDVSKLLRYDGDNSLEVTVHEESANRSVNLAEREADYWIFGGIYRPVFLEASPPVGIERLAIDARHGGSLRAQVFLRGLDRAARLIGRVEALDGAPVGPPFAVDVAAGSAIAQLGVYLPQAISWSAENPTLYRLLVQLEIDGDLRHETEERFGFRTVELRRGRGLFVNDRRVLLAGINRHAFWPTTGRALDAAQSRRDAELIRELNLNAVRTAHYPPDVAFLDACDELGIYVIDELPGWHDAYDTTVGRRLIGEMVERDVNHPSILLWANGNEDGWNTALDGDFARHDPQARPVIHPRGNLSGIDAPHYPSWRELRDRLDPNSWRNLLHGTWRQTPLVLASEFLHGLYDGGGGAGLADFWQLIRASPLAMGGFIWAMFDEGVVRTDLNGKIDTDRNHAPDGVFGPYRQPEASTATIRAVMAPIQLDLPRVLPADWNGRIAVENRYVETDLASCRFAWQWLRFAGPSGGEARDSTAHGDDELIVAAGERVGPSVAAGARGVLELDRPPSGLPVDALRITAHDPTGRAVLTWVAATRPAATEAQQKLASPAAATSPVEVEPATARTAIASAGDSITLEAGSFTAQFDRRTGRLVTLRNADLDFPLGDGPLPLVSPPKAARSVVLTRDGADQVLTVENTGAVERTTWRLSPNGWLQLEVELAASVIAQASTAPRDRAKAGFRFTLPETAITSFTWLGDGPWRIWGNRLDGPVFGRWHRVMNDTVTGASWDYPEAKGFYSGVRWLELSGPHGNLTVVVATADLYVGVFAPRFPDDARDARAVVPDGLSFVFDPPAIGTKFHAADALAPPARPAAVNGPRRVNLSFRLAPPKTP